MKAPYRFLLFVLFIAAWCAANAGNTILIKGGTVYDGTLAKPVITDILVRDNLIVRVGNCSGIQADTVINASGYIVCPGFIDPHSHSDAALVKESGKANENYLQMGVTTVICGVCGSGVFPIGESFHIMRRQGIGTNCGLFVGQGSIRNKVMGVNANRTPTAEEMKQMQDLLCQSIDEGAFGLSTGLYYAPGSYSNTEEIIALAKAMAPREGIYSTHLRSEGSEMMEALDEAIRIAKEARVQLNISHLKRTSSLKASAKAVIEKIETARKEGLPVTSDQYPYAASSTSLRATILPRWAELGGRKQIVRRLENPDTLAVILPYIAKKIKDQGGAGKILISKNVKDKTFAGLSLKEIAVRLRMSPAAAAAELIRQSDVRVIKFSIDEKAMEQFMTQPWVMTCTDGSMGAHPRATGSYPVKIREYVLDKQLLTMTEMVHRSSGMVAETYGIDRRGFIREGYFADIIIFKPETVEALSSFTDPSPMARGMHYVLVNGKVAVRDSRYTGVLAGIPVGKKNAAKDIAIFEQLINLYLKQHGVVGEIVSVVKDNAIIYTQSFGHWDLEGKLPFRKDHRDLVRIASISKSFCATAMMQLVERGLVSLEQTVSEILGFEVSNPHFPDLPITLHMLLSHTSSLNDSQGYKTLDRVNPQKNPKASLCYSHYAPGTEYRYCNLNFNLMGAIVEKISGQRYDKYIKEHILDPLGMRASLNIRDLDRSLCVPLYSKNKTTGEMVERPEAYAPLAKSDEDYILGYDPALFSTTGGMKCDIESLARYMIMHMNYGRIPLITEDGKSRADLPQNSVLTRRIISETSARLMQSCMTTTDVEGIYYGYALRTAHNAWIPGITIHNHTGSAYGMHSTISFDSEKKYGFVTMCNGYRNEKPGRDMDIMLYYHFIY